MSDDLDGDFDVVGYDQYGGEILGRTYGRRGGGGRGGGSRGMQRGHGPTGGTRGGGGRPGLPPGGTAPPWWKGTAGGNQPNEVIHVHALTPDQNDGVLPAGCAA